MRCALPRHQSILKRNSLGNVVRIRSLIGLPQRLPTFFCVLDTDVLFFGRPVCAMPVGNGNRIDMHGRRMGKMHSPAGKGVFLCSVTTSTAVLRQAGQPYAFHASRVGWWA